MVDLVFEADVAAPAETVFDALVDLPGYGRWLTSSSAYAGTTEVSTDPVAAGTTYVEQSPSGTRHGTVTELDRPSRVTFHQPMTMRPVSALPSGCRRNRMASSPSRIGRVQAPEPRAPCTTADSGGPITPRCHQMAAAVMIDEGLEPILQVAHPLGGGQQLGAPAVHRTAVTIVDLQQQAVFGLEMIGHAAGIGARSLRDVAARDGIEAVGRKQLFRGGKDRLPQIRLAGCGGSDVGLADHAICTNVQKIRSGQQN